MPIQGLTNRNAAFLDIGTIRKGAPKTDTKRPGPDLDYLRFVTADRAAAEAFKAAFGEKPREIEFLVPHATLDENFEAWREEYSASSLIHRCDGVTCVQWRDRETGKMRFDPKPCPTPSDEQRKAGGCKQVGRLKIIIPALKRFAFVTVTTTSVYDIISLHQQLLALETVRGTLRGVPMILRRVEREISTPAQNGARARRKKWLLAIEAKPEWVVAQLEAQQREALAPVSAPLQLTDGVRSVDELDDENDEASERAEIEAQFSSLWTGSGKAAADFEVYKRSILAPLSLGELRAKLAECQKAASRKAGDATAGVTSAQPVTTTEQVVEADFVEIEEEM